MKVEEILRELDRAVMENRGEEVEGILSAGISMAVDECDDGALLQLLNELVGYYREVGRFEDAYKMSDNILALCARMGLYDSIPYATSLLNIAGAYRAGGRLEEAYRLFMDVEDIYMEVLPGDSMLLAGFYNNKALLFQEMGKIDEGVESLKKALQIVEAAGEPYETAVTHANLANCYAALYRYEESLKEAEEATKIFEMIDALDSHYAAALYAKGIALFEKGDKKEARIEFTRALMIMEESLGKNEFYYRIKDELDRCESSFISGLELSEKLYEECLKPQLKWKLENWVDKIAVGLVGKGSDCFGFDDEASRDHDWGPDLCIWVTKDTYDQIGQELENIYASLPEEFEGVKRAPVVSGRKRRGVFVIEDFYNGLLGNWPLTEADWYNVQDYNLAEATNGKVFVDSEGQFTEIRNSLKTGYPKDIFYKKITQSAALFSQQAQYNYERASKRGDKFTAGMMLYNGLKEALKLVHYIEGIYPPHDKWLYKSAMTTESGQAIKRSFDEMDVDSLGKILARILYEQNIISDIDDYLDHHTEELMFKAGIAGLSLEELADRVTRLEFKAFDSVNNEGGRASCQDDYYTFEIMRKSQYLTWTPEMLMQYLYDFDRSLRAGHNLITEKYGRMMASTAPKKWEEIKDNFAVLSEEKKAIIESVVSMQVAWMEDFAKRYPGLGGRARSIHTNEDFLYNTSYETYLRGEISTYSDKMLELYGRYIVSFANEGKNVAEEIMKKSTEMYGYDSLEAAESKTKQS